MSFANWLSEIALICGISGATVSSVTVKTGLVALTLPAASTPATVMFSGPSVWAGRVKDHSPLVTSTRPTSAPLL